MSERFVIYTDGASRGNPGPASLGAIVYRRSGDGLEPVESLAEAIGVATNNEAEYTAVIAGLEAARRAGADDVEVRADSLLLVKQLTGEYRVKAAGLKPLFKRAKGLLEGFSRSKVVHVRREDNMEADALANAALDA